MNTDKPQVSPEMEKEIREAYAFLRKNNHSISDTTLDYMLDVALHPSKYFPTAPPGEQGEPFPLQDVLKYLVKATEHLLIAKDYDGPDYEEMNHCVKRAKEIIASLSSQQGAAPVQGWVSVEEKPQGNGWVIVYFQDYDPMPAILRDGRFFATNGYEEFKHTPLKYMPFPSRPSTAPPGSAVSNISEEELIVERAVKLVKKIENACFTRGRRDVLIMFDEISPELNDLKYALSTPGALRKGKTDKK